VLNADDLAFYDREIRKLLPDDDVDWLEHGSGN